MGRVHQSMLQQQTVRVTKIAGINKRKKIRSRQVGVCTVITEQNPTMNTFTITHSQSMKRLHPPPKAKQQTKLPTVVFVKPNEGWQHSMLSEQNPVMKIFMITKSYLICSLYPLQVFTKRSPTSNPNLPRGSSIPELRRE